MSKLITLWLILMTVNFSFSQTISIKDDSTHNPLEDVQVYSFHPRAMTITNNKGEADGSLFKSSDEIFVTMMGYETKKLSYRDLENSNFKIQLKKNPISLDMVVVSAYTKESAQLTSLNIQPLSKEQIDKQGSFNLTDALARVPGVSQFSTGVGISKPVIRGLYGNRILVLFSGLRFDNQQWQDEHGLGLSDLGISKVEIIKGPMSILYGTEAIGGVINILEEGPPQKGTHVFDAGIEAHSNTGGGLVQFGTKYAAKSHWYRLRVGVENHADYTDGNNQRILNSRYNGYYLKSSFGFKRKNWKSTNHYNLAYNNFGFVFSDMIQFMSPDSRWSRAMSGPHHIVFLNTVSSINEIKLKKSILKINGGFQSNYRAEDEGGGQLSLKMLLLTGQYAAKWQLPLSKRTDLVLANNSSVEKNTNYGGRKLVPDAWMSETAFSGYLKHHRKKAIFEIGLGSGVRHINSLYTPTVNSAEKQIAPFKQNRLFSNGLIGMDYIPNDKWNIKINLSSGVRAPNLSELSSNGLHEGIYTYEIGDPTMKNEQNVNGDLGIYRHGKSFDFSLSGFYNYFIGYIYLDPTNEQWYGFPVYRYRQHNARIYGGEATIAYRPQMIKGLEFSSSYSGLIGQLDNGQYLPYMPAQKFHPEISYKKQRNNKKIYAFVNADLVMPQNLVNNAEKKTPGYQLINTGIGIDFTKKKAKYSINIAANNLLNQAYYNHMSRLKNFGLLNMGRDISINFKIQLINDNKN